MESAILANGCPGIEESPAGAPANRNPGATSVTFSNSGAAQPRSYESRVMAAASRSALTGRVIRLRSPSASRASR